ncbi:MAG TPA: aminoacyl-tRNA hydrolase [Ktedonobacteraceae bacterium]|nr:aminoacyl-tRNA hydrolase [Ktedonobacteraceae bacterium]
MKLIVGLGNPGSQYERTRHNVGFRVVDRLATKWGWNWSERRAKAVLASGMIGTEKVVLAKPITFMNLSGEPVGELVRWYKLLSEDILIIYDELDLPVGKLRLRLNGSAAGHNGLRDIIAHLHTSDFPRLRVGIGHPRNSSMQGRDHVLSAASGDEGILLASGEERAVDAVQTLLAQGIEATMNTFNTDPEEAARKAEEQARKKREREERARLKQEQAQQQAQIVPSDDQAAS